MPETKKPKAAVSTPETPLVQADWDEARRTRPHEFLPEPCKLNENAAKEAEEHHKQTPPTSKLAEARRPEGEEPERTAREKDAMRANAPQIQNAPVQPRSQDRRSDADVVQQEGLRAPREEAVRHEVKG